MVHQEEFITFMMHAGVFIFGDSTIKFGHRAPYFTNTDNYKTGVRAARLGDYYIACIQQNLPDGVDCLFDPAYKGTPLVVSTTASPYRNYGQDPPYCFNRKEAKSHGEGGAMAGCKFQDGSRAVVVEDTVTTGIAARKFIELSQHVADVRIRALIVSVDRIERGIRACSTLNEPWGDYSIVVHPIVTVREITAFLHNREPNGRVYIDDEMKSRMEAYLEQYGAR